ASSPAYTRNQVRPVSNHGRTEHEGTSVAAHARYEAKRNGKRSVARSNRSREYTVKVTQNWDKIALASGDRQIAAYAMQQRDIIVSSASLQFEAKASAIAETDFGSQYRTNLVKLQNIILEGEKVREMSRSDFESYEKAVETTLFRLGRNLAAEEKTDLDQIASYARDHVSLMREHMELSEQRGLLAEARGEEPQDETEDLFAEMEIQREPDSEIAKPVHTIEE